MHADGADQVALRKREGRGHSKLAISQGFWELSVQGTHVSGTSLRWYLYSTKTAQGEAYAGVGRCVFIHNNLVVYDP